MIENRFRFELTTRGGRKRQIGGVAAYAIMSAIAATLTAVNAGLLWAAGELAEVVF